MDKIVCRARRPGCLILLVLLNLTACKTELYSTLPENDANDMMAILIRHGINSEKVAHKKKATYAIFVQRSELPAAVELLKEHGFPRERFTSIDQLFKKEGLISSPLEERVRFIYALSQDVQETLSRIDGVVTARVHIVLPENNPFAEGAKPSSASVFIKYLPGSNLADIKSDIKMIVEKSIQGLSYDKVSVVMLPAQLDKAENLQAWSRVWGFRVPRDSAPGLARLVWGLVFVLMALLLACGYLLRRRSDAGVEPGTQAGSRVSQRLMRLVQGRRDAA